MLKNSLVVTLLIASMLFVHTQAFGHHHEIDRPAVEGVNRANYIRNPCIDGDRIDGRTTLDPLLKFTNADEETSYLYATRTIPAGILKYQELSAIYSSVDDVYITEDIKVNMVSDRTTQDTFSSLRVLPMSEYVFDTLGWEDNDTDASGCLFQITQRVRRVIRSDRISFPIRINARNLDQFLYEDGVVHFVLELTYITGWAPGRSGREGGHQNRVVYFPFGVNTRPDIAPSAPSQVRNKKIATTWSELKKE